MHHHSKVILHSEILWSCKMCSLLHNSTASWQSDYLCLSHLNCVHIFSCKWIATRRPGVQNVLSTCKVAATCQRLRAASHAPFHGCCSQSIVFNREVKAYIVIAIQIQHCHWSCAWVCACMHAHIWVHELCTCACELMGLCIDYTLSFCLL